ncbi:MAG: hypothetical protein Q9201_005399 [Fulgogasparrea decipioides]
MADQKEVSRQGYNVSRSKNVPWFQSKIGSSLTSASRELLETYSGILASEVEDHIYKNVSARSLIEFASARHSGLTNDQRDSTWEIFPWPCIGEFWFINLGLSLHPHYQNLLTHLRTQHPTIKFLDLGTCLGQDLRKLVADGAPVESLWGCDYFYEYEAAGHSLFRDADRFQNPFIAADLFDESAGSALQKTEGTWDIININMLLQVYDWNMQVRACKRILKLLSQKRGSMVIGVQTGSTEAGELQLKPPMVAENEEKTVYRQNLDTFIKMWKEVGKDAGLELEVWVLYDDDADRERRAKEEQEGGKNKFFTGPTQRRLFFTVTVA